MSRIRVRHIIGPVIVLVVCLVVLVSYVSYADYREAMKENGTWAVHFEGYIEWSSLVAKAHVTDFSTDYDWTPEVPDYEDWVVAWFSSDSNPPGGNLSAAELFTVRIVVVSDPTSAPTRTLFDEKYIVRYGEIANNQALAFNHTLGPYISHNSSYPIKLTLKISINGVVDYVETNTLRAPVLREWGRFEPKTAGVTDGA